MILAARDVEWEGMLETREDHADAWRFFHSKDKSYAHWRLVWFGLAGVAIPMPEGMDKLIAILSDYGLHRR